MPLAGGGTEAFRMCAVFFFFLPPSPLPLLLIVHGKRAAVRRLRLRRRNDHVATGRPRNFCSFILFFYFIYGSIQQSSFPAESWKTLLVQWFVICRLRPVTDIRGWSCPVCATRPESFGAIKWKAVNVTVPLCCLIYFLFKVKGGGRAVRVSHWCGYS